MKKITTFRVNIALFQVEFKDLFIFSPLSMVGKKGLFNAFQVYELILLKNALSSMNPRPGHLKVGSLNDKIIFA